MQDRVALESKLLTDANGGQLTLTGVATVGTVQIANGEIRATSGVVTYFGDGSGLTGTVAAPNMGVGTDAYVGAGTTLILFSGSSVSSVEADRTSGIATVTIAKVNTFWCCWRGLSLLVFLPLMQIIPLHMME